ncbi:MAG: DUF2807 domain-containing protein [Gammaproteobacteria bacterium]|nr:DUF2807 domain-containing protein [Gammaproteobacteria bacterium]
MNTLQRRNVLSRVDGRVLMVSILFVCCALFSTLLKADIKSVEGLEFTRVLLIGNNQVKIIQGDVAMLKIRGDKNKLNPAPFLISGDTLQLGITKNGHEISKIKYKLTVPMLEALEVRGSGEAFVKPLRVSDLVVVVEGSGDIRMYDVNAVDLEMRVSGSGMLQAVNVNAREARLTLKGSGDIQLGSLQAESLSSILQGSGDIGIQDKSQVQNLHISVMGSGDVSLKKLRAAVCNVSIMGSGDVKVQVQEELDVEIMGSGDLHYWGNPRTSTSVLGSGDVQKRD